MKPISHKTRLLILAMFFLVSPLPAVAEGVSLEHQGIKLHAELSLAPGKSLKDGVIVLLHGTIAHNRMEIMQAFEATMNDRGYNTLAVNLGYGIDDRTGMLDCGVTHTHRHEDAVAELGLWMDWLKAKGAGKVVLMAHSRGGNQAAWYVLEHDSPMIQSLVLVAPMTWSADKAAKGYDKRYGTDVGPLLKKAQRLQKQGKGETPLEKVGLLYCEDATATADAFVSYYRADWRKETPSVVEKLKKPVLVFAGSEDELTADLGPKMEAVAASRDNVRFELIDGSDHFFRDLYAEDVADITAEFIGW